MNIAYTWIKEKLTRFWKGISAFGDFFIDRLAHFKWYEGAFLAVFLLLFAVALGSGDYLGAVTNLLFFTFFLQVATQRTLLEDYRKLSSEMNDEFYTLGTKYMDTLIKLKDRDGKIKALEMELDTLKNAVPTPAPAKPKKPRANKIN